MRYRIVCPVCDEQYYVDVSFEPQMCFKCGHKEVFVSNRKTQPRVNAEIVMAELDELAPKIDAAYEEYLHLTTMWYDYCTKLRYYKNTKTITQEEYDKYRRRNGKASKSKSQRLKEYRQSKREEQNG